MGLFYDSTYLLVILAALISMAASARMNTIFSKYQTVRSYSGMTGRDAAMRILRQAGIYDVTVRTRIRKTDGSLRSADKDGKSFGCCLRFRIDCSDRRCSA